MNAYHIGGHPEILLDNVRVPAENLLGQPGDGFAIMQKRMGPGTHPLRHALRGHG